MRGGAAIKKPAPLPARVSAAMAPARRRAPCSTSRLELDVVLRTQADRTRWRVTAERRDATVGRRERTRTIGLDFVDGLHHLLVEHVEHVQLDRQALQCSAGLYLDVQVETLVDWQVANRTA